MPVAFRSRRPRRKTSRFTSRRKTASRRTFRRKTYSTVKSSKTYGMKKRRYGMKNRSINRRSGDDGQRSTVIKDTVSQKAFVSRTYEGLASYQYNNTSGVDHYGLAFSLDAIYDTTTYSVPTIAVGVYQGGMSGVGTSAGVAFENIAEEFASLSQVFRYFRISKFQAAVSGFPEQVTIPTVLNSMDAAQQGPTYGSMGALGTMLMRSWGGGPGVASYNNGVLVGTDWTDHVRYRDKKVMAASGKGGSQRQLVYSCTPMLPIIGAAPTSVSNNNLAPITYRKTGWIDINNFASGVVEQAGGFGIIFMHYFPDCASATSNQIENSIRFQIQVDYCGLRNTPGLSPALEEGKVLVGSTQELIARMRGQELKESDLVRPVRRLPRRVKLVEGKPVYDDAQEYEIPELKRQDAQQSSVPNLKPVVKDRQLPPSRPPTPIRSK